MSMLANTTITFCCTDRQAAKNITFASSEITKAIAMRLEKRLLKKDIALSWVDESESPQMLIRVLEIDKGNQFLRWLLPFIAPANLSVDGYLAIENYEPMQFQHSQKGQVGLLGGSSRGLLKACAQRIADKIVKDTVRFSKNM